MSNGNDDDIRQLFRAADTPTEQPDLSRTLKRARAGVAQRDTLVFAIVRIWAALAALLAPLFATLAARQAKSGLARGARPDQTPE